MDREQLVLDHLWLPQVVAKTTYPREDFDTKVSDGMYGLVLAARRYQPGAANFATYADHRVRGEVAEGYRRRHGTRRLHWMDTVSLDAPAVVHGSEETEQTYADVLGGTPSFEDDVLDRVEAERVIRKVRPKDREVLSAMADGLGGQAVLARKLGVTESYISLRKQAIVTRLRRITREAC